MLESTLFLALKKASKLPLWCHGRFARSVLSAFFLDLLFCVVVCLPAHMSSHALAATRSCAFLAAACCAASFHAADGMPPLSSNACAISGSAGAR